MKARADGKSVEFFYKKQFYIFPPRTKIYAGGNRFFVEIKGKKVSDVSKYLAETVDSSASVKIGLPVTASGSEVYKKYETIAEYLGQNKKMNMLAFDYATGSDLTLCTFFKSDDMKKINILIRDIQKTLPFLTNIFKRPVIHLKDVDVILPVGAVKRMTNNTFSHFMSHTHNWDSIKNGKAVPKKLLTKTYDDDYGIYENIVFKDLIDRILWFLIKRVYYLSEALFNLNESVQLDAFKRINHEMYYLAIGKLYIGFSRTENSAEIAAMLKDAKQLYGQIEPHKVRPVYAKNAGLKLPAGRIKQTNILAMHKDYKHIYRLIKKLNKNSLENQATGVFEKQKKSQKYYELFCGALALFALKNFNLGINPKDVVFLSGKIDARFSFKAWEIVLKSVRLEALDIKAISLKVEYNADAFAREGKQNPDGHSPKTADALFIPLAYELQGDKKKQYEHIISRLYDSGEKYGKYVFLDPFEVDVDSMHSYSLKAFGKDLYYCLLPVSVSEFNSFRRIQKILFECMIKSGEDSDDCAFCGERLVADNHQQGRRVCQKCRTAVEKVLCADCGKSFVGTYANVKATEKAAWGEGERKGDYFFRLPEIFKTEKRYLFRDIVNIRGGSFVCPHCGGETPVNKKS